MKPYIVLLRGINVGGKNKVPMAELKLALEEIGFENVLTYIQSGNVILSSELSPSATAKKIELMLPKKFKLDSDIIKVLVLSRKQIQEIVKNKPKGFGESPDKFHSDVIFLIGVESPKAMSVFRPREGVDRVWAGKGVVYSERLSAKRTQSRLNKIIESPLYKSITIRNWNTTTKLLSLLGEYNSN